MIKHRRHGDLLPNSIRAAIVGASNCGKTNLMINLVINPNGLYFQNLYIYSKSLNQKKYRYLTKIMSKLQKTDNIGYYTFSNNADVVPLNEARKNSIFIFDDIACCNQNIVREYFSMGRHRNIDCFYLCQTDSTIGKQLIRDNINFLIIFKQDLTNLKHIYQDHVNSDMSFEKFRELCHKCWEQRFGFVVIDKERKLTEGRYKRGFDELILI